MIPKLKDYEPIVGKKVIEHIRHAAEPLEGKHAVHVNATAAGGGVAEILNTLIFLMNDLGINTGWRVMFGSHSFFKITKGMHNALQGQKWKMTPSRQKLYNEYCRRNSIVTHIKDHDIVVIHDPQPAGMVTEYAKKTNWIWRCHIDISHPNRDVLNFLRPFIKRYDGIIVSHPKFKIKHIRKPQFIIHPSIDPLSQKNKKVANAKCKQLLASKGIDMDKPIISQISRFDPWKDHVGVLKMYQKMREKEDCQLILMGDMPSDDPQSPIIYNKIQNLAKTIPGVHLITEKNDLLVNVLQQQSAFVFQNSVKEGFALTVSESLWKKTPVIGTPVGGIPLQIKNGKTGFLIRNRQEGIKQGLKLLRDPNLRQKLGQQGHDHVKRNFLSTRHLLDYINLFNKFYPEPDFTEEIEEEL